MNHTKYFYKFYPGFAEGNASMIDILGNKGANLAELASLNIPLPPGFTLTLDFCNLYQKNTEQFEQKLEIILSEAIIWLENITKKSFGNISKNILLLSVRSGSSVSMPGMLNTILNVGINDEICNQVISILGIKHAYDIYRRFLIYYATNVFNIDYQLFPKENFIKDYLLETKNLEYLIIQNKKVIKSLGFTISMDVFIQLKEAIKSVIKSWNNDKAIEYRKLHNIQNATGTAITIQSMVYGNISQNSGSGVFFTRSPLNGEKEIFGEFLLQSQGEDVVSGKFTPLNIVKEKKLLQKILPNMLDEIKNISGILESHYKDMQDVEFTIEEGKIYILQTRSGKRNTFSAIKILHDMVLENKISQIEALKRIEISEINNLFYKNIKEKKYNHISEAIGGSFGAVTGKIAFSLDEVEKYSKSEKVILVKEEATTEDNKVIKLADAVLSLKGGATSHIAVVARSMGKIFLSGTTNLHLDKEHNTLIGTNNLKINSGEYLTLDGYSGKIFLGKLDLTDSNTPQEFFTILKWAKQNSKTDLRSNSDSKQDLERSLNYNIGSIGLCRTEHMFFTEEKMLSLYQMMLSEDRTTKNLALENLMLSQKKDFLEIFKLLSQDNIVNIRLLDMPLHEFLPKDSKYKIDITKKMNITLKELNKKISNLSEHNPMLGHRGIRLAITHPEIYLMQIKAIFSATEILYTKFKKKINLEIMVPFVCDEMEVIFCKNLIKNYITSLTKVYYSSLKFGCMIELPRAAIVSDKIAPHVDFVSFGTNDLTQTTYGISRDDIGKFFNIYQQKKIFNTDCFRTIDKDGVGEVIKISIQKLRKFNKKIKIGICGEHGSDLESIQFFSKLGVDYFSCSPHKLAQAQIFISKIEL